MIKTPHSFDVSGQYNWHDQYITVILTKVFQNRPIHSRVIDKSECNHLLKNAQNQTTIAPDPRVLEIRLLTNQSQPTNTPVIVRKPSINQSEYSNLLKCARDDAVWGTLLEFPTNKQSNQNQPTNTQVSVRKPIDQPEYRNIMKYARNMPNHRTELEFPTI